MEIGKSYQLEWELIKRLVGKWTFQIIKKEESKEERQVERETDNKRKNN